MIVRELKLRPNKKLESKLANWLWLLIGVYNFGIQKIKHNANNKIYFSEFDFVNICKGHSKRLGIPSHTIQGILQRVYNAWQRCFKKIAKQPKLKGAHNKLRSIPFPDPIPESKFSKGKLNLPGLGKVRYIKQDLPTGKITQGRLVKKASGWYLQLLIDTQHIFNVTETKKKVGIDTGFKHLAVLSDGTKIENPRNFIKGQERLAQAQRGKRKQLSARLYERISNRRKDYNHKVSKRIVQNYKKIYITNDNLKGQAKRFGKSIGDAGISQLRKYISYKSDNHGRKCVFVDSTNTTKTCSTCWSLTGPVGLNGLSVRSWECATCGVVHDRDVNSAMVILKIGSGTDLKEDSNVFN
jgi:putative transposase